MTAAVRIESGDLLKIARNLGAKGKAAPQWVQDDPGALAAYNEAAGIATPAAVPSAAPAATPAASSSSSSGSSGPARKSARRPASTRPASRPRSSSPGYLSRAVSPTSAANRLGADRVARAGDAGGLLLALVIYPVVLSTVLYGADGPTQWFRAKWLNQPADPKVTGNKALPDQRNKTGGLGPKVPH